MILMVAKSLLSTYTGLSQRVVPPISCKNTQFDKKVKSLLRFDIPTLDVEMAYANRENFVFLDTRAYDEFSVSHIKGARYVGYDDFELSKLHNIAKESKIIVYCSIGYRSEHIGNKLKAAGYRNVYNLYGSIFEWCNRGYPIVDAIEVPTQLLHTYNRKWSAYVDNGRIKKVW